MDKRRVEWIADEKKRMGRRLPVLFLGCACTGKRRKEHPLDIRQPDSAAFVHATHPPNRDDGWIGKLPCPSIEDLPIIQTWPFLRSIT